MTRAYTKQFDWLTKAHQTIRLATGECWINSEGADTAVLSLRHTHIKLMCSTKLKVQETLNRLKLATINQSFFQANDGTSTRTDC